MTTNTPTPEVHPVHATPAHQAPLVTGKPPLVTGKPKKRGWIWGFLFLIVAGVAGYSVYQSSQPGFIAQPNQGKGGGPGGGGPGGGGGRGRGGGLGPVPVVGAKATLSPVPVYLAGLGTVTAYYTVTVRSRVDGQLMMVHFNEGDLVQKDQLLAEIDPRPYQVQLAVAEGQFARDTATLVNARLDQERYKTLLTQDAIPKQQLDTQLALVNQLEGTVKTDQANIDNAKLQLVYAHITAPITGRVGLRLVDPGNIVHASDNNGMLTITQIQPIAVVFTVPEDSLPQVVRKVRAGIKLRTEAFNRDNSQRLATGQLETIDNTIDTTTGTSRMKAVFDNADNSLYPNQFVNVRLLVDTLPNQTVVPTVAIQNGQSGTFVYKIDENSVAHLQNVTVGIADQNQSAIVKGLSPGDVVAVDGADRLTDGAQVRVRKPGEAEAEAAADAAAMAAGRGRGRGRRGSGAPGGIPQGGQNGAPGGQKGGGQKQ